MGLQEAREIKSPLGDPVDIGAVGGTGRPDRRVRLLVRRGPNVDAAFMPVGALVVERAVTGGPGLEDQLEAVPQPLHGLGRIGVGGEELVRYAAHESGIEAAAGDAIHHRHLLGDAHRIGAVGDGIAQHQDPALSRFPRQDGGGQGYRGVEAGGRLVMFVEHQVEAKIVGDDVFIEIAVVQIGADLGIEDGVGQADPVGWVAFWGRQMRVGHLREIPGVHGRDRALGGGGAVGGRYWAAAPLLAGLKANSSRMRG